MKVAGLGEMFITFIPGPNSNRWTSNIVQRSLTLCPIQHKYDSNGKRGVLTYNRRLHYMKKKVYNDREIKVRENKFTLTKVGESRSRKKF